MPEGTIQSLSNRSKKSKKEVEKIWNSTKQQLKDEGYKESQNKFYPILVTIVKKKIGLKEKNEKTAVVTIGRFNPPHIGHQKMLDRGNDISKKYNADFFIFPTKTQDKKKNFLPFNIKIKYLKKFFSEYSKNIITDLNIKTIFDLASKLENLGYNNFYLIVGEDRVKEFKFLLQKYNNKDYFFDEIKVFSGGERDEKYDDVRSASSSKMRKLVMKKDYNSFKKLIPNKVSEKDKRKIYEDLLYYMNISEMIEKVLKWKVKI